MTIKRINYRAYYTTWSGQEGFVCCPSYAIAIATVKHFKEWERSAWLGSEMGVMYTDGTAELINRR